ncbi:hypothetical protein [Clostridium sp. L74]|uniref:hypothetical protein n=1 Tax=Clostridium sp. L74 TaxID=1560217 RepID=UPI0006ABA4C5|nr:hypothetical protein [Clostridium sp. L74]KOR26762.1 hypothetical protein ND00_02890 [Clostridium sp. L74]
MKLIKILIIWSIIPLTFEITGLLYVDKYYLANKGQCKIEKVEEKQEKIADKNIKIPIPEEVEDVKISYDGKYISYKESNNINIINTLNGEEKKVQISTKGKICYYTWLKDRHRMYIWEKFGDDSNYLKVSYYDKDKDHREIVADNHYNEVQIPLANSEYNVQDHVISTLNGVEYVKVKTNNNRSNIYRLNVMSQIEKCKSYSKIGKIDALNRDDNFIYEDLRYGKVRVSERENSLHIPETDNLCVLGVDGEDNVYVGNIIDEKVNKIFYGSLKEDESSWKQVSLNESIDREDIYVSKNSKIYINNKTNGIVKEVLSGKEIKYQGRIVQYYNKGIGIINNGEFSKVKF